MIGQKKIQKEIEKLIKKNKLPHFIILEGIRGSGKKLLANEIGQKLGMNVVQVPDVSIASIRQLITDAYKKPGFCFIIPDADEMSNAAKNALLKVTEEPPNGVYFIMTLQDINNTLPTIKSRGTVFTMDIYSKPEIKESLQDLKISPEELDIVVDLCDTPGEAKELAGYNVKEFDDYVELVINNITKVSGANAFKIPGKVAMKDTDEGYDLRLFWKMFLHKAFDLALNSTGIEKVLHLKYVGVTGRFLQELKVKGCNKQMLMDNWILDIRQEAIKYGCE